jgi:hypothetical protein
MDRYPGVVLDAEFRGLARKAGEFERGGEVVTFGSLYSFEYEDAEGVTQTIELSARTLDNAAGDFDAAKATRGTRVRLTLTVMVKDGYALAEKIEPARAAVAA